jgi:hypothetical protein
MAPPFVINSQGAIQSGQWSLADKGLDEWVTSGSVHGSQRLLMTDDT